MELFKVDMFKDDTENEIFELRELGIFSNIIKAFDSIYKLVEESNVEEELTGATVTITAFVLDEEGSEVVTEFSF